MDVGTFFAAAASATTVFGIGVVVWALCGSSDGQPESPRQRLIGREIRLLDEFLSWLEEIDLDVQVLERLERPGAEQLAKTLATHREAAQVRRQLLQKAQEDSGILLGPNPLGAQQAAVKAAKDAFNKVAAKSERYPMSATA